VKLVSAILATFIGKQRKPYTVSTIIITVFTHSFRMALVMSRSITNNNRDTSVTDYIYFDKKKTGGGHEG
jgi:hypothetical protein